MFQKPLVCLYDMYFHYLLDGQKIIQINTDTVSYLSSHSKLAIYLCSTVKTSNGTTIHSVSISSHLKMLWSSLPTGKGWLIETSTQLTLYPLWALHALMALIGKQALKKVARSKSICPRQLKKIKLSQHPRLSEVDWRHQNQFIAIQWTMLSSKEELVIHFAPVYLSLIKCE